MGIVLGVFAGLSVVVLNSFFPPLWVLLGVVGGLVLSKRRPQWMR